MKRKRKRIIKKYENLRNQYNNKEIIGILTIKEINLDTVLVQTDNNDYYMNHLPNRKKARVGSTFIDYRTNIYSSKRVNIYGHNSSKVETDFKKLEKLLEKNTFNKTQKLYIETENGLKEYEIFLVKIITKDDEHTKVEFLNTKEYINHIDKLKENSLYIRDIKITGNDQVLILQTCLLNNTLGDYLIIGAKGGLGK